MINCGGAGELAGQIYRVAYAPSIRGGAPVSLVRLTLGLLQNTYVLLYLVSYSNHVPYILTTAVYS